jgi:hypothetical protein
LIDVLCPSLNYHLFEVVEVCFITTNRFDALSNDRIDIGLGIFEIILLDDFRNLTSLIHVVFLHDIQCFEDLIFEPEKNDLLAEDGLEFHIKGELADNVEDNLGGQ